MSVSSVNFLSVFCFYLFTFDHIRVNLWKFIARSTSILEILTIFLAGGPLLLYFEILHRFCIHILSVPYFHLRQCHPCSFSIVLINFWRYSWPGEGLSPPFVCAILNTIVNPILNRVSCAEMCSEPHSLRVHAPRINITALTRAFRSCCPISAKAGSVILLIAS